MDARVESINRVSLMELRQTLSPYVDVQKQFMLTVQDHARWGVLDLFQGKGVVEDIDEYEALLNSATLDERAIPEIQEVFAEGGRDALKLIINPGNLPLQDFYRTLFVDGGLVPEEVLQYFENALSAIEGGIFEPTIAFVPTSNDCAGSSLRPIDPVTDWLFLRRDLDKNLRRLLMDLRGNGALRMFPNFQRIADWFQFTLKKGNGAGYPLHPQWVDLNEVDYRTWLRLYLQAVTPLNLPLVGKEAYSKYPHFVHKDSGLMLGTGWVSRGAPNAMEPFFADLNERELARLRSPQSGIDANGFVNTLVPEPVFLAPDRQDPWVTTRMTF